MIMIERMLAMMMMAINDVDDDDDARANGDDDTYDCDEFVDFSDVNAYAAADDESIAGCCSGLAYFGIGVRW